MTLQFKSKGTLTNINSVESNMQSTRKGTEKTGNAKYYLQELICLKGWNKAHT